MIQFEKDIEDSEIRIIGSDSLPVPDPKPPKRFKDIWRWLILGAFFIIIIIITGIIIHKILSYKEAVLYAEEPSYFEPLMESEPLIKIQQINIVPNDSTTIGYTEIRDTTINDIPIRIYIPHHAEMTLQLGRLDRQDTTIIYAAQAADVRADNGGIVGAFVLKGEPKAWGLSKKGFCASIDGKVTVGVADNSPLFEQATERGGYFFRQYPLVDNGTPIFNEPKGKAIRRAICDRGGTIFMVETLAKESFYDFAQALADMGIDYAVYLVGSAAYGWAVDREGIAHEFGYDDCYAGRRRMPKNTSYIVWRRK
jgi:hypothetical protein